MDENYHEPLALIIISSISIGIAALVAILIGLDILIRRGWKSMMAVMIPVYVVNALYLWPITLWTYLKYGRPSYPQKTHAPAQDHNHCQRERKDNVPSEEPYQEATPELEREQSQSHTKYEELAPDQAKDSHHDHHDHHHNHEHHDSQRPFFATVTIGVCHCGAGCVLGDIVGEWLVYGTNAYIGSHPPRLLWAEMLVDFGFAFLFGLVFQYFSIAPMSGDYGWRSVVRALKADALSLLSFEVGLFAWMAAFQIGIFSDHLGMTHVTYWWMMQIGMFIGHWTAVPVNIWLIKSGIKEPCA